MGTIQSITYSMNKTHRLLKYFKFYRYNKYFKYLEITNIIFLISSLFRLDDIVNYFSSLQFDTSNSKILRYIIYPEYKKLPITYKDKKWILEQLEIDKFNFTKTLLSDYMMVNKNKIEKLRLYFEFLFDVEHNDRIKEILNNPKFTIDRLSTQLDKILKKSYIKWRTIGLELETAMYAVIIEYYIKTKD